MTRFARTGASLLGVAIVLILVPIAARLAWLALSPPVSAPAPTPELRAALIRAGLDAEALAAAGVSSQEATALVSAFSTAMAAEPGRLANADSAYASARVSADALQRKVASGLATQNELTAYGTAKASLASAEAERADVLADWAAAATGGLSPAKVATLAKLRANRHWQLPVEFLVKDRAETEWVAVRKALNNERIAPKYGDLPNAAQQAALATWRADPTVATAKASSDLGLAVVKSAWTAATGG